MIIWRWRPEVLLPIVSKWWDGHFGISLCDWYRRSGRNFMTSLGCCVRLLIFQYTSASRQVVKCTLSIPLALESYIFRCVTWFSLLRPRCGNPLIWNDSLKQCLPLGRFKSEAAPILWDNGDYDSFDDIVHQKCKGGLQLTIITMTITVHLLQSRGCAISSEFPALFQMMKAVLIQLLCICSIWTTSKGM